MEVSNAHNQAMVIHSQLGNMLDGCSNVQQQEKKMRPPQPPDQALKCPRCDSTNTKFCYYNNYSLSQPRYFCKGCRRYWTHGGTLRNVPVGGGCRKNKRPLPAGASSSTSSTPKKFQEQDLNTTTSSMTSSSPLFPQPFSSYDPMDLNLAFATLHNRPTMADGRPSYFLGNPSPNSNAGPSSSTAPTATSFLEILRSGFADATNTSRFYHDLSYGVLGNGMVLEGEGGVGGEQVLLPFDGLCGASTEMAGETKMMVGMQWHAGGDGSMALEPARDFYWNGVGGAFHGLINSPLM